MEKECKYELLIVGGGLAGCAAAYTAAKKGLKTLLVEKNNYLGGLATGGLVVPVMKSASKGLNTEFFSQLVLSAKKFDSQATYDGNEGWFNPITLKIVLDELLASAGAEVLYESQIVGFKKEGSEIVSLDISNGILSLPFYSKYFVDATGSGNLAKLLNCEFWTDTEQKQPSSLRFVLSGVDVEKFSEFILELDKDRGVTTSFNIEGQIHLSTAYTWDTSRNWALRCAFEDAVKKGVLKLADTDYFQIFTIPNATGSVAFNCPRIKEDELDGIFKLSNGLKEARAAIFRLLNFCKLYLKGFERAYISSIADMTGVRESGRVKCRYDYTIEDIYSQNSFVDAVLHSDYPVDIHSNKKDGSVLQEVRPYSLPLRSLVSKDYDNLYVAGRCLGADFKAQAALRVQAGCMSMGEAVAKDIASKAL